MLSANLHFGTDPVRFTLTTSGPSMLGNAWELAHAQKAKSCEVHPLQSCLPLEPEAGYNRGLYVDNLPRESLSSRWQKATTLRMFCQEAMVEAVIGQPSQRVNTPSFRAGENEDGALKP